MGKKKKKRGKVRDWTVDYTASELRDIAYMVKCLSPEVAVSGVKPGKQNFVIAALTSAVLGLKPRLKPSAIDHVVAALELL